MFYIAYDKVNIYRLLSNENLNYTAKFFFSVYKVWYSNPNPRSSSVFKYVCVLYPIDMTLLNHNIFIVELLTDVSFSI